MYLEVYGDTLCALVSAAAMASTGHQVTLHVSPGSVANTLDSDEFTLREPGLASLMLEQKRAGRLVVAPLNVLPDSRCTVLWLALSPDTLELAHRLVEGLPADIDPEFLVVNQSTFPVGSTEALQQTLLNRPGADSRFGAVVSVPDLLTEGAALTGFTRPNHWLVGADMPWASRLVAELLRPFNRRRDGIMQMRPREAEFTKLAINGMLATRLSYMNDMANLADSLDVDIERVRQGMGADTRIGEAYLYPGCGFGGLSFSRDVMSLASTLQHSGLQAQLLEEVLQINERQKETLFRKLWRHYDTQLEGRRVAIWGVAFKPESARIDNAPALKLIEALWAQGVQVHVHDPRALPALQAWAGTRADLVLHDDPYAAAVGADALMLVTEWKSYWSPDFTRLKAEMATPLLLDGRNVWDPDFMKRSGFVYHGIGRR
ncbi:MAG TPA: nucleotide sugar dehydrogenase [Candidatus Pseudomonas excrementavium]|uniref:UDP-glucose dehydrogenase family protein n=1 Tax=Halopseudomonas bauzanensis TaxID=653930 RepID=UPI001C3B29C1|nr:nucleotide sugar dehydrogenase [Halopseudomonas bauzanensis]HIZ49458.1 nucleotide sugar dehydrogenase [Candidatus Pseudomonas excrementavium]